MSPRDRLVALGLAMAVLLAGAWFGLVSPQRQLARQAGAELSAAQARRGAAVTQAAAAEQARTGFAAQVHDVSMLSRAVPEGQGIPALLRDLETTATANQVDFRSVKTGDPSAPAAAGPASSAPAGGLPAQSLSLTFAGDFLNLERFLDAVNHYTDLRGGDVHVRGRLLSLREVHLATGRSSAGRMEASVTAVAYSLPAGQSPAALLASLRSSAGAPSTGAATVATPPPPPGTSVAVGAPTTAASRAIPVATGASPRVLP